MDSNKYVMTTKANKGCVGIMTEQKTQDMLDVTINLNNFNKISDTRYVTKGITINGLEGVLIFYPTSNKNVDANEVIDFCVGAGL